MKKTFRLIPAIALLLAAGACSNDEPGKNGGDGKGGDVYATLTIDLPEGTRSETVEPGEDPSKSSDGNEVGQDFENNVDELLVVLADKDETAGNYKYIASTVTNSVLDQTAADPTYTMTFESEALQSLVEDAAAEVYVVAYCNPSDALKEAFNKMTKGVVFSDMMGKIAGATADAVSTAPYAKRKFLMTNAAETTATIPVFSTLLSDHNTPATAFSLGEVKVERVASRFDFQSKAADSSKGLGLNQYLITDNPSGLPAAIIEMNGMALFNVANDYYLLPRVADNVAANNDNAAADAVTLLGKEKTNNWVVSPNAVTKKAFAANTSTDVSAGYQYYISTLPKAFNYTEISSLGDNDNDDWTNAAGTDYKIWTYATENTLPSVSAMRHGLTTGVIFRGEIKAAPANSDVDESKDPAVIIKNAMDKGETLYAFTNVNLEKESPVAQVMLGSAMDVYKYAWTHIDSEIRRKFIEAFENGYFKLYKYDDPKADNPKEVEITVAGYNACDTDAAKEAYLFNTDVIKVVGKTANAQSNGLLADSNYNFMAYAPEKVNGVNHYYVYYYYYNRHNDNNRPVTNVMEFATVRNNIYKLSVSTVSNFGLPGDIPDKPDTPDEDVKPYFKVAVKVLKWVVRVNKIEF